MASTGDDAAAGGRGDRASSLRLVVASAQPALARSLELVLGPTSDGRIEVVGAATAVDEAVGVVGETSPDLVLVDLDLPAPGGVELVHLLGRGHGGVRVLAMARDEDLDGAVGALRAGAEAVVPTSSTPEQMLAPLLAVLQGWRVLSAPVLDHLLGVAARPGAGLLASLSDDERSLWRMVAAGREIAAIGDELFVSERTAKRMVAELRSRLGVRTRIEMAALAGRCGLLD